MVVVFPDYTHFLLKSENEQEAACTGENEQEDTCTGENEQEDTCTGENEQETTYSQILAYLW